MAKKKTNIQKVAEAMNGKIDSFSDKSSSWVHIEDSKYVIDIEFDGKGDIFKGISIHEKIYEVVDEKLIAEIKIK